VKKMSTVEYADKCYMKTREYLESEEFKKKVLVAHEVGYSSGIMFYRRNTDMVVDSEEFKGRFRDEKKYLHRYEGSNLAILLILKAWYKGFREGTDSTGNEKRGVK